MRSGPSVSSKKLLYVCCLGATAITMTVLVKKNALDSGLRSPESPTHPFLSDTSLNRCSLKSLILASLNEQFTIEHSIHYLFAPRPPVEKGNLPPASCHPTSTYESTAISSLSPTANSFLEHFYHCCIYRSLTIFISPIKALVSH